MAVVVLISSGSVVLGGGSIGRKRDREGEEDKGDGGGCGKEELGLGRGEAPVVAL